MTLTSLKVSHSVPGIFVFGFCLFLLFYLCVCVAVCEHGGGCCQKRPSESLKLDSQAVVSCLVWVLGTEPRSSWRAAGALCRWPTSVSGNSWENIPQFFLTAGCSRPLSAPTSSPVHQEIQLYLLITLLYQVPFLPTSAICRVQTPIVSPE